MKPRYSQINPLICDVESLNFVFSSLFKTRMFLILHRFTSVCDVLIYTYNGEQQFYDVTVFKIFLKKAIWLVWEHSFVWSFPFISQPTFPYISRLT